MGSKAKDKASDKKKPKKMITMEMKHEIIGKYVYLQSECFI